MKSERKKARAVRSYLIDLEWWENLVRHDGEEFAPPMPVDPRPKAKKRDKR